MKKLCVHCKHFKFKDILGGMRYAEIERDILCENKFFNYNFSLLELEEFKEIMLKADKCESFELAKDMK